mmetsp:Transcript_25367/g.58989  ORF Transcript_25367/g.58989 Transcript_25367/m.58989 type:complete len:140 (-) Transcript_25367:73-492(-)
MGLQRTVLTSAKRWEVIRSLVSVLYYLVHSFLACAPKALSRTSASRLATTVLLARMVALKTILSSTEAWPAPISLDFAASTSLPRSARTLAANAHDGLAFAFISTPCHVPDSDGAPRSLSTYYPHAQAKRFPRGADFVD